MPRPDHVLRAFIVIVILSALMPLLSGCGAGNSAVAGEPGAYATATMGGHVHGGNQPVNNAAVYLYAAGTSGYGAAGTLYAQTATAADGSFQFTQTTGTTPTGPPSTISTTYACPTGSTTNPDPQMYIIAQGGETGGVGNGANSAAAFVVALGHCSGVGSLFVNMNEVVSVATMAALQQYFNPVTESFGYPLADASFFANGVATVGNLVDLPTGTAKTSVTYSATPLGATNSVTVTVTPESQQVNTLADILAACVNNTSRNVTACNTLFADALAPDPHVTSQPSNTFSGITSTNEDTNQALYFLLTNPTSGLSSTNMTALFNLITASSPFANAYTTAPTDWTVAINYGSTNTCTLAATAGTTDAVTFLGGVNDPAIDGSGNVWGGATGSKGGLFEISPTGSPLTCGLGALTNNGSTVTIDTNGNPWIGSGTAASGTYYAYKWNASSGAIDSKWPVSTTNPATAMVADGKGNLFYADPADGVLGSFAGAGVSGASSASPLQVGTIPTTITALFMAADNNGAVYTTDTSSAKVNLYEVYPSTGTGNTNGYLSATPVTTSSSLLYDSYGVAIGYNAFATTPGPELFMSNGAGSGSSGNSYRWVFITPNSTIGGTDTGTLSSVSFAGNGASRGVAVDGASNVWQGDNNASSGNWVTGATTAQQFVSEVSANGAALSATSASGTSTYGVVTGGFQKPSAFFKAGTRGVAIDSTGNVWVGQNTSTATGITELVGAGVPVVTPLSVGAKLNKLGQMP